jgi:hypothetical protein
MRSTVPATTVAGALAGGVVKLTLTNSLSTVETGKFTAAIYASPDGTLDTAADAMVGSVTKSVSLKTQKTTTVSVPVKSLAALPAGSYELIVQTTDRAGNTADAVVPQSVNVAAATVRFTPAMLGRGLPATAMGNKKLSGSVEIKLTNTGNATSPGPVFVGITASMTPGSPGYGIAVKSFKLKIKPGRSAIVTVPLKLMPAIPAGAYYTVAVISDPSADISVASSSTTTTVTEG